MITQMTDDESSNRSAMVVTKQLEEDTNICWPCSNLDCVVGFDAATITIN